MSVVRFSPQARQDTRAAFDWYEGAQAGLAQEFAFEVAQAIGRIVENPDAWPILRGPIRRCRMHRFPYGVLYSFREETITIVAVMHLHRHPDAWRGKP